MSSMPPSSGERALASPRPLLRLASLISRKSSWISEKAARLVEHRQLRNELLLWHPACPWLLIWRSSCSSRTPLLNPLPPRPSSPCLWLNHANLLRPVSAPSTPIHASLRRSRSYFRIAAKKRSTGRCCGRMNIRDQLSPREEARSSLDPSISHSECTQDIATSDLSLRVPRRLKVTNSAFQELNFMATSIALTWSTLTLNSHCTPHLCLTRPMQGLAPNTKEARGL